MVPVLLSDPCFETKKVTGLPVPASALMTRDCSLRIAGDLNHSL